MVKAKAKSAVNTAGKQRNGKVNGRPFKPGKSGNPAGRPLGSKNFTTLFEYAIKEIAKDKELGVKLKRLGVNSKDIEKELVVKAVVKALGGSYHHFRDLMDRKYGKATDNIDIRADGDVVLRWEDNK